VKLGGLLEGMADSHNAGLVERFAGDLKRERQSVLKADRDREGRTAGQVVRCRVGSPLEGGVGRHRVDPRRRPGRIRRNRDINIPERLGEIDGEFAPPPCRLDIVRRAQKRPESDPRKHVMAEELGSLAEIGLVQRIGLRQHDQAVGVEVIGER